MVDKKIVWSPRARKELKNIFEFYNERNGNNAYSIKLLLKIEKLLEKLSKQELIGRLTSDGNTRVLVMNTYLVFYEISSRQIAILSVWNNRQNPKKRLPL